MYKCVNFIKPVQITFLSLKLLCFFSLTSVLKGFFLLILIYSFCFRGWIKGAVVLIVLLGLTWGFGLFYVNEQSVVMAYIFTVLNSLQGLLIFIFHCFMNEKV